jgi:hypothetical protein
MKTNVFKYEKTCNNCWKSAIKTMEVVEFCESCCTGWECYWTRLEVNTAIIYSTNEFRSEIIGNMKEERIERALKSRWISQIGTKKCKMKLNNLCEL